MFSHLIRSNPDDAKAREALAITVLKNVRKPKLLKPAPKCRIPRSREAIRTSITQCDAYLVEFPRHTAVRAFMAELLLAGGWLKGAQTEAQLALMQDAHNVKVRRVLVKALEKQGNLKDAGLLRNAFLAE